MLKMIHYRVRCAVWAPGLLYIKDGEWWINIPSQGIFVQVTSVVVEASKQQAVIQGDKWNILQLKLGGCAGIYYKESLKVCNAVHFTDSAKYNPTNGAWTVVNWLTGLWFTPTPSVFCCYFHQECCGQEVNLAASKETVCASPIN